MGFDTKKRKKKPGSGGDSNVVQEEKAEYTPPDVSGALAAADEALNALSKHVEQKPKQKPSRCGCFS